MFASIGLAKILSVEEFQKLIIKYVDGEDLSDNFVYTDHVRRELISEGFPNLPTNWSASVKDFKQGCQEHDRKVVGVMALRPLWAPNLGSVMTPTQQTVRRYWLASKFYKWNLCFVEVLSAGQPSASSSHDYGWGSGGLVRGVDCMHVT